MTVIANTSSAPLVWTTPLPPTPTVDSIRQQVTARLATIQTAALPMLTQRRQYLERLWGHDGSDAVRVFASPNETILADPVGADRLAEALADQHALEAEAVALGELSAALDRYEAGGSLILADFDAAQAHATTLPRHEDASHSSPMTEEAFSRFLQDYLHEVREEIWSARQVGDRGRWEKLETEYAELQKRIRARYEGMRALTRAICGKPLSRSA